MRRNRSGTIRKLWTLNVPFEEKTAEQKKGYLRLVDETISDLWQRSDQTTSRISNLVFQFVASKCSLDIKQDFNPSLGNAKPNSWQCGACIILLTGRSFDTLEDIARSLVEVFICFEIFWRHEYAVLLTCISSRYLTYIVLSTCGRRANLLCTFHVKNWNNFRNK